jgi:hypothetical protein
MLDAAIASLKPGEAPIIHSDRGVHYRWPGWIEQGCGHFWNLTIFRTGSVQAIN